MSQDPLDPFYIVTGIVSLFLILMLLTVGLVAAPFILAGWGGYYFWSNYNEKQNANNEIRELYDRAKKLEDQFELLEPDELAKRVVTLINECRDELNKSFLDDAFYHVAFNVMLKSLEYERFPLMPTVDLDLDYNNSEGRKLRRDLKEYIEEYKDAKHKYATIAAAILEAIVEVSNIIPASEKGFLTLSVPVIDILKEPQATIQAMINIFFDGELIDRQVGQRFRDRFNKNLCHISNVPYQEIDTTKKTLIWPNTFKGTPSECARAYLAKTPLLPILFADTFLSVPEKTRFEHTWFVGSTGVGKTTALKKLILYDLMKVEKGECSVVLMDSKGVLIPLISHLAFFNKELKDRLVLIDASDIEYPVQINPFHIGKDSDQQTQNTAVQFLSYLIDAVLGAEMTSKQATLFRYVVRLLMVVDDATIHTFRHLFEKDSRKDFERYIKKLPKIPRAFFETEFWGREFTHTRSEVLRRIWTVLENDTIANMFAHPEPKLDMFKEMNAGKVILIDARKSFLSENGVEIFGRTILTMIALAIRKRGAPDTKKLPCHIYIDECHDYFSGDDKNITFLLEQAREQKVSITLLHQLLSQMPPRITDSLLANTAIKMVNTDSAKDAGVMARSMRCHSDFILNQETLSFAVYARGTTKEAMTYTTQIGLMEDLEQMTEAEWKAVRALNRECYAIPRSELERTPEEASGGDMRPAPKGTEHKPHKKKPDDSGGDFELGDPEPL